MNIENYYSIEIVLSFKIRYLAIILVGMTIFLSVFGHVIINILIRKH